MDDRMDIVIELLSVSGFYFSQNGIPDVICICVCKCVYIC